jgi:hypothetical protein
MKLRLTIIAAVLAFAASSVSDAPGEELGYTLRGNLLYAFATFDELATFPGEFTARLVYDDQTEPIYNLGGCDCASYRQEIYGGFAAQFENLTVRADAYFVEITNDFALDGGSDFVRIVFSSAYSSLNGATLVVNDVPRTSGVFVIHLKDADGTALVDHALPQQLNLADFESRFLFLKDSPADLIYEIAAETTQIAPLAVVSGDYNFDVVVDGNDFLIWQRSIGSEGITAADGDRNQIVDQGDLIVWRDSFGKLSITATASALRIAEPAAGCLAVLAMAAIELVRKIRFDDARRRR